MHQISKLIQQWNAGDKEALNALIALTYQRLHTSSRKALGIFSTNASIQATELVNELYLSFHHQKTVNFENAEHFFAVAALKIRQILHSRYEKNISQKRNGGQRQGLSVAENMAAEPSNIELIVSSGYLDYIQTIDPINARIAELKLFWEFNNSEIAEILNTSESSVLRKWRITKALIAKKINDEQT